MRSIEKLKAKLFFKSLRLIMCNMCEQFLPTRLVFANGGLNLDEISADGRGELKLPTMPSQVGLKDEKFAKYT